jgi:fructose-1-phosphate kinase PfkB-like protein
MYQIHELVILIGGLGQCLSQLFFSLLTNLKQSSCICVLLDASSQTLLAHLLKFLLMVLQLISQCENLHPQVVILDSYETQLN